MEQQTDIAAATEPFEFIGGALCLDFVNTVGGLRGALAEDTLADYGDLVRWSEQAGLLTSTEADALQRIAAKTPDAAQATFRRAISLREALYTVFMALATEERLEPAALAALNVEIAAGMRGAQLAPEASGFVWAWPHEAAQLDVMLGPIARSTATLLTSDALHLVRQCGSATCGWLFVDTTKNHRRRWCTPTGCGNKARVRRHRERRQSAGVD